MSFEIEVRNGKTAKLPTAGKYCDRDILVTATGGYTEEELQAKYDEGVQAEYDRFWNAVQHNGTPCNYNNAFSGVVWNKDSFKPKYKITPSTHTQSAREMFQYFNFGEMVVENMAELTYDMMDMSECTNNSQVHAMFQNATFKRIEIDLSGVSGALNNLFQCNNGGRIYNIRAKINASAFNNCFSNATMLETLILEEGSTIGGSGFNVQWSTNLSKDSITSIVNALSSATSGLAVILSKTAVDTAFTAAEWSALAGKKLNWTINLV